MAVTRHLFHHNKVAGAFNYWDHYYNGHVHQQLQQRRYNKNIVFALVGGFFVAYWISSASYAYWSLSQHEATSRGKSLDSMMRFQDSIINRTGRTRTSSRSSSANRYNSRPDQKRRRPIPVSTSSSLGIDSLLDPDKVRQSIQQLGNIDRWRPIITAFLEEPLNDTIPNTGDRGDMNNGKDHGQPPQLIVPLPLRTQSPDLLRRITYPNAARSCRDMPAKFPVNDAGLQYDAQTGRAFGFENMGDNPLPSSWQADSLPHCPVESDPFLPWIHDVFPSTDASVVHIVAQNRRRCRTGRQFTDQVNTLRPQVALMQPISVQQISESRARALAPDLWHDDDDDSSIGSEDNRSPRYRLAPRNEIDQGHNYTRFICRFTTPNPTMDTEEEPSSTTEPTMTLLGETLSTYEFNYEYASYRKRSPSMWTPKGKDTKFFWTSTLRFECPVPQFLQAKMATGELVLQDDSNPQLDGTALVYLDIIPIRTSVRYKTQYLGRELIGPDKPLFEPFNPKTEWGDHNVIPAVEASGRWTNIPICTPPKLRTQQDPNGSFAPNLTSSASKSLASLNLPYHIKAATKIKKPHFLSACLWASVEFKTRGVDRTTSDTLERLVEWLEFHFLVGFDHVYVYDNTGAHTNRASLKPTLQPYIEQGHVTLIDWPHRICNNNIPAHDSTGERSSQYAAENSCRTRHAPFTEWIASFDTDEYLVPMGKHQSLKTVLHEAHEKSGANILSFRSSRGKLRESLSFPIPPNNNARERNSNTTFLQAYNCDGAGSPKPEWADRARKQVYLADYVLYHYVHYSTVTLGYMDTYESHQKDGSRYIPRFREHAPYERETNELTEAVMVHAKTIPVDQTTYYEKRCMYNYTKKWQGCWVGFPWPNGTEDKEHNHRDDGIEYNCFINESVETTWVPKLEQALMRSREKAISR